jgi:glutathione S-transferase
MTATTPALRLYGFDLSGHVHRVRLMLSLLSLPFEDVAVDLRGGEHKQPAFLARNPFGQVPVLQAGDETLADSNAILVYLALTQDPDRRWLPADPLLQARVQRWLSAAAGPLAQGAAAARVNVLFKRPDNPQARATAQHLLGLMDAHLTGRDWLAADHATIADVAMYSYTAHAPEGGVSLDPWPQVRAWLQRVQALPGFVGMKASAVPDPL